MARSRQLDPRVLDRVCLEELLKVRCPFIYDPSLHSVAAPLHDLAKSRYLVLAVEASGPVQVEVALVQFKR